MVSLTGRVGHVTGVCDNSRRDISGPINAELIREIVIAGVDEIIKRHEREIRNLLCVNGIDEDVSEKGA